MNQYSGKNQERIEAFIRRREARLGGHLGRLAFAYARQQQAQATQPPPVEEPDQSDCIEGTYFVIEPPSDDLSHQEAERIELGQQTTTPTDVNILGLWQLTIACAYYGRYLLALNLLGLAGVLLFLKCVRVVKVMK